MVAVAELLSMKIPSSYEVLFPDSPMRGVTSEPRKGEAEAQGEYPGLGGSLKYPSEVLHCWLWISFFLSLLGKEKQQVVPKGPESGPEWLKQFDAMLPGYSLKNELDILTLLKQVGKGGEGRTECCSLFYHLSW